MARPQRLEQMLLATVIPLATAMARPQRLEQMLSVTVIKLRTVDRLYSSEKFYQF
jgi:hypothetical protein